MNKSRPSVFRLVSHMLAALFNSRAAFHEQWRHYESAPARDAVAGRWIGEWISEHSGHRGALKCVLARAAEGVYRAYFYASFSKLFSVGYVTDLKAESGPGVTHLNGEQDLGPLAGGIYRCDGEITGTDFVCHYSCKYDQGTFRLKKLD
ncbi:MAG TPA: hypothetical protein VFE51_09315 [Verrucomicrobiae bacterium]|nr:hypothetical protein [Verrucomicrobiae bacterium]